MVPALLAVILMWGGSYSALKAAQVLIPPLALAGFRSVVAAVVLIAGMALVGRRVLPSLDRREWGVVVLVGLTGTTAFQLGLVGGLGFTTPAHSALIITLNPVFAALLARLWLGEPLSPRRVVGIAVAFGGVTLILTRGTGLGSGGGSMVGDLLSLGAALAWAVYSVAGKLLLVRHPALEVTACALAIGSVPLAVVGFPELVAVPWSSVSAGMWVLLAYLSIFCISVGYGLWYWALARVATARVTVFSYLTPVVAVTISVAMGQESLTAPLVAGALAVITGVILTQLR